MLTEGIAAYLEVRAGRGSAVGRHRPPFHDSFSVFLLFHFRNIPDIYILFAKHIPEEYRLPIRLSADVQVA